MRNLFIFIISAFITTVILISVGVSATYRGTYTDSSGVYASPTASNVVKNGGAWAPANLVFSNPSTGTAGDRPGSVLATLSNATTAGLYTVYALDSGGTWHTLEVTHDPNQDNAYNNTTGIKNKTDKLPNIWPF